MALGKVFLLGGKRTPFGAFGGSLKDIKPVDLAVFSSKMALESAGVSPQDIDHTLMANVIPSTSDTLYGGRHLGLKLGVPTEKGGYNINRLCGSGIEAILSAKRLIQSGEANLVLVSGTENMSMVPHLTYGARFGTKYGPLKSKDLLLDSLTDEFCNTPMGITAENLAQKYEISRQDCEDYSFNSHKRANDAYEKGYLKDEVISVELKNRTFNKDEHLRGDISIEDMKKLKPSFQKNGVVTPATASGIVDGAASVLIASEAYINKAGLKPLCEVVDGAVVGVDPTLMGIGPCPAIKSILNKHNLKVDNIDLYEINEAFASQLLACKKELSITDEKLNIFGGSVAVGHPLGATGVRISLTLARQLHIFNAKMGIASACIGGGQGIALLLKSC
ncbi:MAG: thiolase family protein [Bdellovibrionales bacterium]|nr:thiolase family protein [Bdellovibrionales bacterium]